MRIVLQVKINYTSFEWSIPEDVVYQSSVSSHTYKCILINHFTGRYPNILHYDVYLTKLNATVCFVG